MLDPNDLRKGMKGLIKARLAAGFAKWTVKAWEALDQHVLGQVSNQFWRNTSITTPMITQVLRYRFGQLWNMKIAYRQGRPYLPGMPVPYSARCPH